MSSIVMGSSGIVSHSPCNMKYERRYDSSDVNVYYALEYDFVNETLRFYEVNL